MSFDTPLYVLFLCAVVLGYRVCPRRFRPPLLLAASLLFYACWSAPLTLVILGVAGLTFICSLGVEKAKKTAMKKIWLAVAVSGCAGLLIWFKYLNFLASSLFFLAGASWTPLRILLPVGCSFYTFQALSYVLDVYRGRVKALRRADHYALYICFFPQLVAGPIERADALLPQLTAAKDADRRDIFQGLSLLLTGYFRKLVIADLAAPAVNRAFAAALPDGSAVFLGAVLFSLQIYCDFAGYSEIAQGSALLLGIRLRRNFDRPYLSRTLRAFWRRWHMSLTEWFTDYVYVPLGGSRRGTARQIAATMAVFLLSGLWHGANWTFMLWGLFHGIICSMEILTGRREASGRTLRAVFQWGITAALVLFSWILFRAESAGHALTLIQSLFSPWSLSAGWAQLQMGWADAACLLAALFQLPLLHRMGRGERQRETTYFFLTVCILIAWFLRAAGNGAGTFIYFQF